MDGEVHGTSQHVRRCVLGDVHHGDGCPAKNEHSSPHVLVRNTATLLHKKLSHLFNFGDCITMAL